MGEQEKWREPDYEGWSDGIRSVSIEDEHGASLEMALGPGKFGSKWRGAIPSIVVLALGCLFAAWAGVNNLLVFSVFALALAAIVILARNGKQKETRWREAEPRGRPERERKNRAPPRKE